MPNIVMPLLGGLLMSKVGKGRMLLVCSILVCIGQFLIAFAPSTHQFWLMVLGRVIFGIGSETMYALKATYTCLWFYD